MIDKEIILKSLDDAILKCGIIKSSPYYRTALKMSEKYGLKIKRCTKKELRFVDEGHVNPLNESITSTELRFDEMLDNDGQISFDNKSYESEYTLDDILGYYSSMPEPLKNRVGLIVFEDNFEDNRSTMYSPKYKRDNVITITNKAYNSINVQYDDEGDEYYDVEDTMHMERILAHEMGHCFEFQKLDDLEKSVARKIINGSENEKDNIIFYENILPKMHTYSKKDGVFGKAVFSEAEKEGKSIEDMILSGYAKKYFLGNSENRGSEYNRLAEHFAETVSVLSFKNKPKKYAKFKGDSGSLISYFLGLSKDVGYDDVLEMQPESSKVVLELLELE